MYRKWKKWYFQFDKLLRRKVWIRYYRFPKGSTAISIRILKNDNIDFFEYWIDTTRIPPSLAQALDSILFSQLQSSSILFKLHSNHSLKWSIRPTRPPESTIAPLNPFPWHNNRNHHKNYLQFKQFNRKKSIYPFFILSLSLKTPSHSKPTLKKQVNAYIFSIAIQWCWCWWWWPIKWPAAMQ